MFVSLHTTNFRKLQDNTFSFKAGLNAVLGPNEQGKSTMFEALAYAMFGVDALREPLADVVTWGEKESSLKVVLKWNINNAKAEISRGKSGAEIKLDGKLVATGQKEVTRFVEGLLGAPPKVAAKLMLANQASLRGALADGPTATAQLIEQLSNFALIDEVISLVQEHLPSGALAPFESRLAMVSSQLETEKPGELDLSDREEELASTNKVLGKEAAELATAKAELPAAQKAAEISRGWARRLESAQTAKSAATTALARDQAALSRLQPASSVSPAEVDRLRLAVQQAADAQAMAEAFSDLSMLKRPDPEWDDTRGAFDVAVAENAEAVRATQQSISELLVRQAQVAGRLIKEQACAFCGKDLKDVPEVARLNSTLGLELQEITTAIEGGKSALTDLLEDKAAYDSIAQADRAMAKVYAKHAKYIRLEDTAVPPKWVWTGPVRNAHVTPADPAAALRAAEAEVRRANQDQGRKVELDRAIADNVVKLAEADKWITDLEPKVKADRSTGLENDLVTKIRYHEGRITELNTQAARQSAAINTARQVHEIKVQGYSRVVAAHAAALKDLEEVQLNNTLLKKLRGARPKVADKLWGTVLATISHYFGAIRGTQSSVARDDAGFKVDGKPVPGLSGSTLDALGLAIRIALTKTFLPNNDFLILDEPAAACDADREANMLAVITTAGFEQVLLVTHSQLADAFAEKVIAL